jgi:hypothetical protein
MAATLQQRVEILERELSVLKTVVQQKLDGKDWRSTFGLSREDPEFEEMVRLGREYRDSLREGGSSSAGP